MKTFKVIIGVAVPAFTTVVVRAESKKAARKLVQDALDEKGWDSPYWTDVRYVPNWSDASGLDVATVEDATVEDATVEGETAVDGS